MTILAENPVTCVYGTAMESKYCGSNPIAPSGIQTYPRRFETHLHRPQQRNQQQDQRCQHYANYKKRNINFPEAHLCVQ